MNNYCTKCGNILQSNNVICSNCKTIAIKDNRIELYNKKLNLGTKLLYIFVMCILAFCFAFNIYVDIKDVYIPQKHLNNYLKTNYSNVDYTVKYEKKGDCVISGNCDGFGKIVYFACEIIFGNNWKECEQYEYLSSKECTAYYYYVKVNNKDEIITVVNHNGNYSVVKGRNIYGKEK